MIRINRLFARAPLIVCAILVFGGIGVLALLTTHAATPVANLQPESGTLSSKVSTVADSSASGGKAVKFGPGSTGGGTATVNGVLGTDPNFFPIGVWDQTPEIHAADYKAIGVNMFIGLYNGVAHSSLVALDDSGMTTIADQDATAFSDPLGATAITAWLPYDEPDNAQPDPNGGYDPCIPVSTLQSTYDSYKSKDPQHRPVMLGFGMGVAVTNWIGRGTCTGDTQYYIDAASAGDIFGYDIYPINGGFPLEDVAKGIDNLRGWVGSTATSKPVWADIETTDFGNTQGPTPAQTKFEVWSAIIHGAKGIDYFCHIFSPSFNEAGLLADPNMSAAVAAINAQITSLAAVINVGTNVSDTVTSSAGSGAPIDTMTRTYNGATYILAADMRGKATTATYKPAGVTSGTATVLGENRTIPVSGGSFSDHFNGYDVHLYKIQ